METDVDQDMGAQMETAKVLSWLRIIPARIHIGEKSSLGLKFGDGDLHGSGKLGDGHGCGEDIGDLRGGGYGGGFGHGHGNRTGDGTGFGDTPLY